MKCLYILGLREEGEEQAVVVMKRKYKTGEIAGWMRPPLGDDSADEGNDLDDWEEEEFRRLCLCKERPKDMAYCRCGCLVYLTREEWQAKKEERERE